VVDEVGLLADEFPRVRLGSFLTRRPDLGQFSPQSWVFSPSKFVPLGEHVLATARIYHEQRPHETIACQIAATPLAAPTSSSPVASSGGFYELLK
jgi:hypothetical protein